MNDRLEITARFRRVCLIACSLVPALSASAVQPAGPLGPATHRPFSADAAPGVVGAARALGRGPVAGYFQPVAFSGPDGTRFALPQQGAFPEGDPRLMAGLMVGHVYRFRVTGIPRAEGAELYPTVEIIDRTYPPPGLATQFPIPINLDEDDLLAALDGRLVTRVIYLEDPQTALAVPETPTTSRTMDLSEYQDALEVADRMGRPVAIVRIGSLTPPSQPALMSQFLFHHPAWAPIFQPDEPTPQP